MTPLWRVRRRPARASSISRTTSRSPTSSSRCAKASAPSSTEALHHARHGDRPGQDRERQRPRRARRAAPAATIGEIGSTTFRPPYTPVAIGAFAGHHRGKHFRPTRLHAVARMGEGAGRGLRREPALGCARSISRDPARPDWLDRHREVKTVRERGRHLRRLDARQDRRAGPRRRHLPRSRSTSTPSRRCRSAKRATA